MSHEQTERQLAEGSDYDSSDSDFFNSSLSIWRGPMSTLEGGLDYNPIPLDLHTACSIGNYDCVRTYINSQMDLNCKNRGSYTPLMYAAYIGHDNIVNLLLDACVDVNLANDKGHTPLMLAASCGNESVCYFLREAGAELEAKDKKGWTALFHATYNGHSNLVKFLIESGADINAVETRYGFTPLMQSATQGHEIIVQCLLEHGANISTKSRMGDTARSLAMKKAFIRIVSLIDNKALTHESLRPTPHLGSDGESSSEEGRPAKPSRQKRYNINEGPEAMSRMMPPQQPPKNNVTFREQPYADEPREPTDLSQFPQDYTDMLGHMTQITVDSDDDSVAQRQRRPRRPGAMSPTKPTQPPRVQQVSPTVKPVSKPTDLHELLQQLSLLKYEPIFTEQDIDLEVFLTLSADDLKEIGIKLFGPRRKMTNAIESWHKEHGTNANNLNGGELVEQLQSELREKNWQLSQARTQLCGYQNNIEHYHKELEQEKNIRSITESYLLTNKALIDDIVTQCRETRKHCSKALKSHGKIKTVNQILRARQQFSIPIGVIPPNLQETLSLTDETTRSQVGKLAASSTEELWEGLQQALAEGSKSTAVAVLNLDKVIKSTFTDT